MNLHPKAAGAGLAGSLSIIILWAMSYGVTVPTDVAAAFTAVLAFAGAYLAPWFASVRPGSAAE